MFKKLFLFAFVFLIAMSAFTQDPVIVQNMVGDYMTYGSWGVGNLPKIHGTWFYVDAKDGKSGNDGLTPLSSLPSLTSAYDKCTTGAGDGICIFSRTISGTSYPVDVGRKRIIWSKYGITVVGVSAGNGFFNRARVVYSTAGGASYLSADTLEALIYITGQNNKFINVNFYNGPDVGTAAHDHSAVRLSAVQIGGPYNSFYGCGFMCIPDSATAYKRDLELRKGSDYCYFKNCWFGSPTYDAGNNAACWIGYESETSAANASSHHIFDDCIFEQQEETGTVFTGVKLSSVYCLNGVDMFRRCTFTVWKQNNHADLADQWSGGSVPNTGNIGLQDCFSMGFTAWTTSTSSDFVFTNNAAAAVHGGNSTPVH
jgi:hypothetical protein